MKALIFTGQGCQKQGMGADLYAKNQKARELFDYADSVLEEKFTDIMFNASEDILLDTRNTQLAVFIYEVVTALSQNSVKADFVAGHSLGEYSALVYNKCIEFDDAIRLIKIRGNILNDAFRENPGAMGAVVGLSDDLVVSTLQDISKEIKEALYVANFNGPGQIVIAGKRSAVKHACKVFKEMGAKRAFALPMNASGHNPSVYKEASLLESEINKISFSKPDCPILQCADGLRHTSPEEIRNNLIKHLTHPVLWTMITRNLVKEGVDEFYEVGTDDTLQKIVSRMYPEKFVTSIWNIKELKSIKPYNIEQYELK